MTRTTIRTVLTLFIIAIFALILLHMTSPITIHPQHLDVSQSINHR
jgi:hypothetical protein